MELLAVVGTDMHLYCFPQAMISQSTELLIFSQR
jgi:hypothetical protein